MKKYRIVLLILIIFNIHPSSGGEKWWDVYFTSPGTSVKLVNTINPQKGLINTINESRESIDGAFYDISSPEVAASLIQARKRGVDIRLVTEKNNYIRKEISLLMDSGIPVLADTGSGLMHHKFAVIDKRTVWTGSYNITSNGSFKNNNNAIKIISPGLASIYLDEFREMYEYHIFGNKREFFPFAKIFKNHRAPVQDSDILIYFSPDDDIEKVILKTIRSAKKSIHFMAFSFTSDAIGEALIASYKKGVPVLGLFEKKGSLSSYSEYIKMKIEGLPVKRDRNRHAMHHKVMIIDEEKTITGSYNFSKGAGSKNDENMLIITNREIAGAYLEEFRRLY